MHAPGVPGAEARGARVARPQVGDHHVRGEAQPRGPAARNSGHPAGSASPGGGAGSSSQPHGVGVGGRRPEVPSVQESLMRLGGGCGAAPFRPTSACTCRRRRRGTRSRR